MQSDAPRMRAERLRPHATLPPRPGPGHVCQPELIVAEITSVARRPLTGRLVARGEDRLSRRDTRVGPSNRGTAGPPVHRVRGEKVTGAHDDRPVYRYHIRVRGRLGETICTAFPALQAHASGSDTVLTGPLPDRAAVYGVLAQIEALGLELLEVRRLPEI